MDDLVKYIMESYENNSDIGIMGSKLLDAINNKKEPECDDEDIAYLREINDQTKLVYVDFYSWNNLPLFLRDKIKENIKVVEESGSYFSLDDLDTVIELADKLDNYIFYLLFNKEYYRLVTVGGSLDSVYSKNQKYLKYMNELIAETVIKKFYTGLKK